MDTAPLITIVIPTYNALTLLPQCIESVVKVSGDLLGVRILIRVQDGLSDDGTKEFLEQLPLDGLSIVSEKDSGVYDAMNKSVRSIITPWVYFLGADDRLLPNFVDVINMLDDQEKIYYGNVLYSSNLKKYDGKFSSVKLVYRNICHQAIFFPSRVLQEHPYKEKYPIKADWASNIMLMSKYKFHYMDYDIAIYNNKDGISANNTDVVFESEKHAIFRDSFGLAHYLLSLTAPLPTMAFKLLSAGTRE